MSAGERWLPITEAPDYEVSDEGRVRSWKPYHDTPTPRLLRLAINNAGYQTIGLYTPNGRKLRTVHSLVAAAFLGPRPSEFEVRHLDGNPLNNHVGNLRYGTRSENALDAVRHQTHRETRKTHCPQGHPYDEENTYTFRSGWRRCRTCLRARWASTRRRGRRLLTTNGADQ